MCNVLEKIPNMKILKDKKINVFLLVLLLGFTFNFNVNAAYPLAQVTNNTNQGINVGVVKYASAFCENDSFMNLAPGKTWKAKSRGACLITSVIAILKSGQPAFSYESIGTSYSQFTLVQTKDVYRVFSEAELTDSSNGSYPVASIVNYTKSTVSGSVKYALFNGGTHQ